MAMRDIPIENKLRRVILQTSGFVLLLSFVALCIHEFITFRQNAVRELTTIGKIVAGNSTAALVFDTPEDANEILEAFKAESQIVAAALYNRDGKLFAFYPNNLSAADFPPATMKEEYKTTDSYLIGIQPVTLENNVIGSLYLKSDMSAMYDRLKLYVVVAALVIAIASVTGYFLSRRLQKAISTPILGLAQLAQAVSEKHDYSVRAVTGGKDEIGALTQAFNHMLQQIELQSTEIQRFNQQLEQVIESRTKELETANKELEAFSYSVSHDLRAPLRSIDGYSRVMIEDYGDKLDNEGKRLLSVIVRNAVRMGQLIDDLLNFSRLGKQSLIKVNLDMNLLTTHVAEDLRSQHKKDVNITLKPMLEVEGDSSMIRQVLTNLISNAIKYSNKKEKPAIEIGSFQENGTNIYYVKDNGAGFDMKYYDKLFGVFQRLHNGSEFEGTGVGLALVQRIISKHNGKVWAEGKVDEGATFYFALPRK